MVRRIAGKLVKRFSSRFVGINKYISKAIPKLGLRELSKPSYFTKNLRRIGTEHSEQRFRSGIEIGGGESAALLEPSLMVGAGTYHW